MQAKRFLQGNIPEGNGKSRSITQVSRVTNERWLNSLYSRVWTIMEEFIQGLLGRILQYDNHLNGQLSHRLSLNDPKVWFVCSAKKL